VIILGAGFGGIGALKNLRDANIRITLIDKCDYHAFQPLLYEVATEELTPNKSVFRFAMCCITIRMSHSPSRRHEH
jgi:NADH dehydrogenase